MRWVVIVIGVGAEGGGLEVEVEVRSGVGGESNCQFSSV